MPPDFSTTSPASPLLVLATPELPAACVPLVTPNIANTLFSLCILAGILISYAPQHYRILSRRSAEGISPYFLLLGTTSGTCALLNILILSRQVLACCAVLPVGSCLAGGLGVAQVGSQWACFAIILVLFVVYPPREDKPAPSINAPSMLSRLLNPSAAPTETPKPPIIRTTPLSVAILSCLHLVVHVLPLLILPTSRHSDYATFLGLQATTLASIQYIPQLYTTYTLGHIGSLSIPMMMIQTPGSFVWAASLAAREGTEWSSWVTYLVTGCLQGCLLVMGIYWEIRDRRLGIKDGGVAGDAVGDAGERQRLVGNEVTA